MLGHRWIDTVGYSRWETEDYGVSLEWEQYELTAEKPKEIKGKAAISINDRILQFGHASRTLRWKRSSWTTP